MTTWVAVGVFGALGALARYGLDLGLSRVWPSRFPVGTFVINVVGSFALGVLFALVDAHPPQTTWLRPGLGAGFLGAFTTFSTFSLQTVLLLETGEAGLAALYAGASLAAGLLAVWGGLTVGRAW
ncbi:MAG TPA: CrcB family protein [Actinomycetota bacterium]